MMGKAAVGFRPIRLNKISDGAYSPMPKAISAPMMKCATTAIANSVGVNVKAAPPPGISPRLLSAYSSAAINKATPTIACTRRNGSRTTIGAPTNDPTTAAAMQASNSQGSTLTRLMKISACATVGRL